MIILFTIVLIAQSALQFSCLFTENFGIVSNIFGNGDLSHDCHVFNEMCKLRHLLCYFSFFLQFLGETVLAYMEFHLDSAEYCQAQHK